MEMYCILKHFSFNFSKFLYSSSRLTQKCTMENYSCEKLIGLLVLNLKTMLSARMKIKRKDFCIVLAGKRQNCRDRAPLIEGD